MLKRLFLLLFSVLILLCFSCVSLAAGVGDINEDGDVTAADARLALRFAVLLQEPTARQRLSADADHDGVLSAADARLILRDVVELERFTHPFDREDHTVVVAKAATCAEEGLLRTFCVCGAVREEPIPKTDDHTFPEVWTIKTPAACETAGAEEKRCAVCGLAQSRSVPAAGHAFAEKKTDAGCETEGLLQLVCARCGKVSVSRTVPPTGHTLTEALTKAPACTEAGEKTVTCANCDYVAHTAVPALGHAYAAEPTVLRAATCTQEGIRSRVCSRCGAVTDNEVLPALSHDFAVTKTEAAACTQAGYTLSVCSRCGLEQKTETAPALGHNYTVSVTAATCTKTGESREICSRCGAVGETQVLPVSAHDYRPESETLSDCTLGGERVLACSVCGARKTEMIPAGEHQFAPDADGDVPAGCTAAGKQTLRCTVCGAVQITEIPATGHRKTRDAARDLAPTCTVAGKEGYVCALCGADLSLEISPAGHTPETVPGTPPTCTADGVSDETVCAVCKEVLAARVALPAVGHSFSAWEADGAGVLTRRCTVCGETQTKAAACEHQYTQTIVTPPGCETVGEALNTCALCGDEQRELLPPTGHDYQEAVVPPTCAETGYTRYTCAFCGNTFTDDETPALGHSGVIQGQKDATCTAEGSSGDLVCSRCGETLQSGKMIPKLPHTPAAAYTQTKTPACVEAGEESRACTVCGAVLETRTVPALGHTPSYVYENGGALRKTVCGRCGEVLETARLTAVIYDGEGNASDVFALETALSEAPAGSTVVLLDDYTLRQNVTVPAGVCFVLPCFAGDRGYTENGGIPDGAADGQQNGATRFCALTVPAGRTLTVAGTLLINAVTGTPAAGPGVTQDVSGGYAEILLSGALVVKAGGCLDCAGYIKAAPAAAQGSVTLEKGAALYETAAIPRFRGTTNALYAAYIGVYPIYEQSMQAVQVKLVAYAGAAVYGRTKLCGAVAGGAAALHAAVFPLIGEAGLFRPANGGRVERETRTDSGGGVRFVYSFFGGADLCGVDFTPLPGAKLSTGDYLYPLSGEQSFRFYDGDYRLRCDLLLLPGAEMVVDANAALSVPAGTRLLLAGASFYEKDALVGDCAYPGGRAPAVLTVEEAGAVFAAGTLAGQVVNRGTLQADAAARTATIYVPTELNVTSAHKNAYTVTIS